MTLCITSTFYFSCWHGSCIMLCGGESMFLHPLMASAQLVQRWAPGPLALPIFFQKIFVAIIKDTFEDELVMTCVRSSSRREDAFKVNSECWPLRNGVDFGRMLRPWQQPHSGSSLAFHVALYLVRYRWDLKSDCKVLPFCSSHGLAMFVVSVYAGPQCGRGLLKNWRTSY